MVDKLNSIIEYLIWYGVWDELSRILPTFLIQMFFGVEWSKIMTIQCLALHSARILRLVQDFSEEVKECKWSFQHP